MWILTEPFLLYALVAAILAGALCAFIGVFISLKNIIFVGLALSEVAALGVAAGFFFGIDPILGAFVLTIGAGIFFWNPNTRKNLSAEALIGFVFCFAGALSITLISQVPMLKASGVDLLTGNILYISRGELLVMIFTAISIFMIYGIFFRKFLYVSFDPETATATGISSKKYNFLIYLTLSLTIAVSMKSAGVLFVFGSLIIPPILGLMLGNRIWKVFVIAIMVSVFAAPIGLVISYHGDYPSSPMITLVKATFTLLIFFVHLFVKKT